MPRVRDLLYRLRPSGAPGAANPPGVPADRAREAEDELAPVLALLETVEAECHRIVEVGQRDADAQRAHDREVADDLVARARSRAPAEREAARVRALQSAGEEVAAAEARGRTAAERVDHGSRERLPHYVDLIVARVAELSAGHVGEPEEGGAPTTADDTTATPPTATPPTAPPLTPGAPRGTGAGP